MDKTKFEIILYCKDQQKSRDFYSGILNKTPILDVAGMTEFQLTPEVKLGLMPEKGIVKILENKTPDPASGNGIPRCELYLYVNDPEFEFNKSIQHGAKEISMATIRDWGDIVAYISDLDGHIVAFAKKI
ncbi:MAG: VOC family protein [Bacteroidia bacterium]|nr:VOC family protein [Bacteroidia bacterium]